MRRLFLFCFVFTLIATSVDAQSFYSIRRERSLLVTFGSGTAAYLGEMTNPGSLGKVRYNIVFGGEYYLTNRISARAELTYFNISGSDETANDDRVERNLSFTSNNFEISATGAFNLFPNGRRFYQRPGFNLYGFAGIGVMYMNPKAEYQGEKVALQPLQTEGVKYSRIQPVIPYGLGARLKFGPFVNVMIEGGYRKTFTDYLDDVSIKRYPDPTTLSSDLSRALSDRRLERDPNYPVAPNLGVRGNPDNDDGYFLLNVKVQYYLPAGSGNGGKSKVTQRKRKAFYRYNKRGGLRR
ncbi:MAG: outer membrane beta-barrel protein [Cyclobacteriaceae bacterium]|nr:outer membrane beta-barrel protein [Cyclobacteriaceae bacterium]